MSVSAYCVASYVYSKLASKEKSELLHYYKLLYKYSIVYTFLFFFICLVSVPLAMLFYVALFAVFALPKKSALWLLNKKHKKKKRTSRQVPTP